MAHPIRHFKTITRHRHEVIKNCKKAGILWQGLRHDLSKYTLSEFVAGAKNYLGTASPNVAERKKFGYSSAWLHHKGRNKHHFEYWTDYSSVERKVIPIKMPLRYVVEMFCDRVAASKIYKGESYTDRSALEYFEGGKTNRLINQETSDFLEHLLVMLAERGEEKTFAYIKALVNKNKEY